MDHSKRVFTFFRQSAYSILLQKHLQYFALVSLIFLISACSGTSHRDSAPKNIKVDLQTISNAVPKNEPFSRYGNPSHYSVLGKTYYPLKSNQGFKQKGNASWYGTKFHGKRTSSGETYDMYAMTAAHKTLPLPTYVRVTNLDNNRWIVVKVNDRGPFHAGRIIDLSYVAALKLDIVKNGTGRVEIEVIDTQTHIRPAKNEPVFIQVGAYSDKGNAQRIRDKLAQASIESDIHPADVHGAMPVYRVRIGPIDQVTDAHKLMSELESIGVYDAEVTTR